MLIIPLLFAFSIWMNVIKNIIGAIQQNQPITFDSKNIYKKYFYSTKIR
jgi:hypothetical protein